MKVYTSAVVIIPPEVKWGPIQEIRKTYDRQIDRWMPHITLLYPFRPENEYSTILKEFTETCKYIKPFEISLKKFKFFVHGKGRYTIWLDPKPDYLITQLQAKILKLVPDCNDVNKYKNGFTPHLSVGQVFGKNNLNIVLNSLQKNWNPIDFTLNQIYFISRRNNKTTKFKIIKQFPFS